MQIIDWKRAEGEGVYVDHEYDFNKSDYLYQIVPDKIEKGLDLTPALEEIFSAFPEVEVLPPEEMFPCWTVRVVKANVNPWIQEDLSEAYPQKIIELFTDSS